MTSQAAETLRSRYAAQVASDLDENHRLQQELAERIRVLAQEEALLTNILKLAEEHESPADVASTTGPGHAGPAAVQAAEPAVAPAKTRSTPPSKHRPAAKPAAKSASRSSRSRRPASTTATSAATAKEPGAPRPTAKPAKSTGSAKAAKETPRQPLLRALLLDLLGAHSEPRLAKELRDELMERYPERKPTPQVVRNTLESLVAKGRIRRHKQQRSVMYTVVETAGGAERTVGADEPGTEPEPGTAAAG